MRVTPEIKTVFWKNCANVLKHKVFRLIDLERSDNSFKEKINHLISKILGVIVLVTLFLSIAILGCNLWVEQQTRNRVYSDIDVIPMKKVALVLGSSKYLGGGRINLYFKYRIEAAVCLYKAGKVKHLLVSGDNRRKYYNEPLDMKKSLMEYGIPEEAITLDYAGFRTLDSIIRAKKVFSQDDIIIVSQRFHNQRALFIGDYYKIKAIGFNARDVPVSVDVKIQIREYLARLKAVLDLYILKTQPKFLGEKVNIPV